jgi:hypothetical protein
MGNLDLNTLEGVGSYGEHHFKLANIVGNLASQIDAHKYDSVNTADSFYNKLEGASDKIASSHEAHLAGNYQKAHSDMLVAVHNIGSAHKMLPKINPDLPNTRHHSDARSTAYQYGWAHLSRSQR